jgi:hypothetical protein
VEKYGTARQATDDKIQCMYFACGITKATGTHSQYVILVAFPHNSGYVNAPQCYVVQTLPVLLKMQVTWRRDIDYSSKIARMASNEVVTLHNIFGDHIIICPLWSPCSQNVIIYMLCDYYPRGSLKDITYNNNPHIDDDFKIISTQH